jgi:flagellar motor switch protein FliM
VVLSIPLTLTAEIGNPKTSIGKLMKSTEGDIFAMATPENVLVKVAGEKVFFADIGKVGPNAAISMKKRIAMSGVKDG